MRASDDHAVLAKQVRYLLRHGPSAVIPIVGGFIAAEDETCIRRPPLNVRVIRLAAPFTVF
jgi:hypothetical protein